MRKKNRQLKKTKIEIIPMIDTMFFLLVFFILSSVGAIKLQGLNINLPKDIKSVQQPPKDLKPLELTISIQANGDINVNRLRVPPGKSVQPYLEREVMRQKQGKTIADLNGNQDPGDDVQVIVSASAKAKYEQMVRCIDQARDAGIFKFAIVPVDMDEALTPPPAAAGNG
jgi:biopolymer transport protein ExbD